MPFALFVPERSPNAEDAYAKQLAEALSAPVIGIAGRAPRPDEVAYASARKAWESLAPATRPLIAGASLPAFAPLAPLFPSRNCAVFVHHPLADGSEWPASERPWLTAVERETLSLAPHVVVSSAAVGEAIGANGAVVPARISVVEPPCQPCARARGSSDATTSLLTGGAFVPASTHAALFAALAGLLDLDWRLAIIAGTEAHSECPTAIVEAIARFGLTGRVVVADAKERARCEALWLAADIFALAGGGPGYDAVIAVALKRGLPVAICRDKDGAPSVPPEAGAIAPPGDHAGLGKALRRMIFDRGLRKEMAAAALHTGEALPDVHATASRLASALG